MRTIPLHGKIAAGRVALVDDEDYGLVNQYHWHAWEGRTQNFTTTYAITFKGPRGSRRWIKMHWLVAGQKHIDHRDHDGLNNTRANLRPATQGQNNANRRQDKTTATSRFRGVHWHRQRQRWAAQIRARGQRRHLGLFDTEEEAARAYDAAALAAWGEYASPNFPEDRP